MLNPSRKNDIDALVVEIKSQHKEIESLYYSSLQKKEIGSDLKIKIKNYLENARSILDYCAHDIAAVTGIVSEKIYFPIVGKNKDINSFEGSIGSNLPNLKSKNINIFNYLESIQPYHIQYSWLADFATVTIDFKHSQLTPQTKIEIPALQISHEDTGIRLSGGASISIGTGASISLGGAAIQGGQTLSSDSQHIHGDPRLVIKKEIWIDFRFNDTISALSLIKKIHDCIPTIVEQIYHII